MSKKRYTRMILSVAAAIAATACTQQLQTTYDSQDKKIDSFISSQLSSGAVLRVYVNEGSNRLVIAEGEGEDSLAVNGTVTFNYAAYTFTGSLNRNNLFATNHAETAEADGWGSVTELDTAPCTWNLANDRMVPGLRNGLFGVKAGQECYIVFNGKYGFGSSPMGNVPANSALLYHIWVTDIRN